ncbi:MAG: DUF6544 family protein [Cellulosilyticaceae bacterium]
MYILGGALLVIGAIILFFNMPGGKAKREFDKLAGARVEQVAPVEGYITEEDIAHLPTSVQKYFRYSGFVGMPKMAYMKIDYKQVDFMLEGKAVKMDYEHYNFVDKPERVAYIDTALMGIPFQGIDRYLGGEGSMKGVIAKLFTLFDIRDEGEEITMKKAGLVTCLAEGVLLPELLLQDYIQWEVVDENRAKATITYQGLEGSGIFTFDEEGAFVSFYTTDREQTDTKGGKKTVPWEIIAGPTKEVDGRQVPSSLKASWKEEAGDLVYFDSDQFIVTYY